MSDRAAEEELVASVLREAEALDALARGIQGIPAFNSMFWSLDSKARNLRYAVDRYARALDERDAA